MSVDPHETRRIPLGEDAEAAATARSRGTYPRREPGRYLEVDAIASREKERADRLRLASLIVALVAFLAVVVACGVLR